MVVNELLTGTGLELINCEAQRYPTYFKVQLEDIEQRLILNYLSKAEALVLKDVEWSIAETLPLNDQAT